MKIRMRYSVDVDDDAVQINDVRVKQKPPVRCSIMDYVKDRDEDKQ